MYAVNISDLANNTPQLRFVHLLVAPVLGETVLAEPKCMDGHAICLDCDLEQAEAILRLIKEYTPESTIRCYRQTKTTPIHWQKL